MRLCLSCVLHPLLKILVEKYGKQITRCRVCGARNVLALDVNHARFGKLTKALIRYYYAEWQYNEHWGGDGLEGIFYKENPILRWSSDLNELALETAVMALTRPAYSKRTRGISLFAGYSDFGSNPPMAALKDEDSPVVREWATNLRRRSVHLIEAQVVERFQRLETRIKRKVRVGTSHYRARIGYDYRAVKFDLGFDTQVHYRPHTGNALSAPPSPRAARMNREGVPFLYLSSDRATAIAEVRPHTGHEVSVGRFRSVRDIAVADLTGASIADFCDSDTRLDDFQFIRTVDVVFSRPLPPEVQHRYGFTQLLADALWSIGYDAVRFRSSVADGSNLAVFNPSNFKFAGDAEVVRVDAVKYEQSKLPRVSRYEKYDSTESWSQNILR